MKKVIFTFIVVLFTAASVFASDILASRIAVTDTITSPFMNDTTRPYATKLGQNWFISATGNINWWQGSDQIPAGDFTKPSGPTFGAGLAVGKWITHNLALRLSYDVNQAHSYINGRHVNLQGIQFLYGDNPTPITVVQDGVSHDYYQTTFMYHHLHGDVMISPVDLIQGYYYDRFYTPILYVGMGAACVSEHIFVTQSLLNHESRNFELSFTGGLVNNFRLSNALDLNLSFMFSGQEWHIDSWYYEYGVYDGGSPRPRIADFNYSASLGFTYYPPRGRVYEYPHNYAPAMKENTVFIEKLIHDTVFVDRPVYVGDTLTEIVSFPLSIFFHRDKYELMSGRDLVNLREIAEVAKAKGWKVRLRGSCDSATATAEYNQRLSENRCRKIQMLLMDMGVPEDQMILVPVGGVKELDPTEYDRRVLIELVKELK